jgi:murein DD-endopeptidase MepM/ murein hydrolase activator NlpD
MSNNRKPRRGPSQEERRRYAANKPLGGDPQPQQQRRESSSGGFSSDRIKRWYTIMAIIMLVAILLSLVPSCFVQGGIASAAETPVTASVPSYATLSNLRREAAESAPTASLGLPTEQLGADKYYAGESGHFIKGAFLESWRKLGGEPVLGLPLSEEYTENGRTVQLFERALLELNPAATTPDSRIQLGFLGRQLAAMRGLTFAPAQKGNSTSRLFFAETNQAIAGSFKTWWERNNGIAVLGFPIGGELKDGNVTTQYFERGVLQLVGDRVRMVDTGTQLLELRGWQRPTRLQMELNIDEDEIYQGRTLAIRLAPDFAWKPENLKGKLGDQNLRFVNVNVNDSVLRAFRSFAPWAETVAYPLSISYTDPAGRDRNIEMPIKVVTYNFPLQNLYLPDDRSDLASSEYDEYDDKQLDKAYNTFTPQIMWSGLWGVPTTGEITTEFGQRRAYGDSTNYSRYHGGLDIAQVTGAPVYAPADGVVTYVGTLQARGKAVALDHGAGVTSYYFHLNSWVVKPGDKVKRGQIIAQVGNTGRSSGAHLHWEVRVNGVITHPRLFQALDLSN